MVLDHFSNTEILQARKETPGVKNVIHFNNAGASLMPERVMDAVVDHIRLEAQIGGYEAASRQSELVEKVYDSAARLIGAQADEIAVIENATRAWDMAFYSIPFNPGDKILTAKASYASNYIAFLHMAQLKGVHIEVIPDDEDGQVSVSALEGMIDNNVKLVAITHVPTNGGLVNPAEAIGKVTRKASIIYLLDACQSVGQMPVNVADIGCDMLSTTSRKYLRGPRGMGFLYVRKERIAELSPPIVDLHAATWVTRDQYELVPDAKRFENWETNYAAKIGMGTAIDYALGWGVERIWHRVQSLAQTLRGSLSAMPGVIVHDKGKVRCGIVTFTVAGTDAEQVRVVLQQHKINVTTSTLFSTRLDMEDRELSQIVRASIHYYNSIEEIEQFCAALSTIL